MSRWEQFFSTNFMAPHGFCFLWLPEIVWLHVAADILIAFSYFSIPVALWYFARKRPDMPFRTIFILFATFITLCGLTHVMGVIVLWWPAYGVEGLVMLATGIVSAMTAVLVWRIMPKALTLPGPSELQEINRQLNASYDEVERKVRERTAELERLNADLTEARRKADAASEAKSEFLANMSHEIRTPMNAVVGIADLLKRSEPLTPKQAEFIATLQTSAESLLALINDLLDIEKIERQDIELESIPFQVVETVEDAVRVLRMRAQEKELNFTLDTRCTELGNRRHLGDPARLRQILLNLGSNAIKFTQYGGVTITLDCQPNHAPGTDLITIAVRDTGIGIPPENHARIFEKFMQADTSISRRYGGTGLGLSIVRRLVELMDGSIVLESAEGEGSCFTIRLPLRIAG